MDGDLLLIHRGDGRAAESDGAVQGDDLDGVTDFNAVMGGVVRQRRGFESCSRSRVRCLGNRDRRFGRVFEVVL